MTPHMEAIAFRIWQVAEPRGWDLTLPEAAEMARVSSVAAGRAASAKGWVSRFRANRLDSQAYRWRRVDEAGVAAGILMGWDQ